MKLFSLVLLLSLSTTSVVFAGGWLGGKCGSKLNSQAYQICAERFKTIVSNEAVGQYFWVDVSTPEFKSCEASELQRLKQENGCA